MGIYFLHIHKSAGTQFCRIAKRTGNHIAGKRNCGPTVNLIDGWGNAKGVISKVRPKDADKAVLPEDHVLKCEIKRASVPDPCCVWVKSNANLGAMRVWPVGYRGGQKIRYEVEVPLWNYRSYNHQEGVLRDLAGNPSVVANERFISPVVEKCIRRPAPERKDRYCVITILRDALDRAYSNWKFDIRSKINVHPRTKAIDYANRYMLDNLSTRMLCGQLCLGVANLTKIHFRRALENLKALDCVALMEDFSRGMDLIQAQCKALNKQKSTAMKTAGLNWMNLGSGHTRTKLPKANGRERLKSSPVLYNIYLERNKWDIKLYAKGKAIYEAALEKYNISEGPPPIKSSRPISLRRKLAKPRIEPSANSTLEFAPFKVRFEQDYRDLKEEFASLVPGNELTRIKFPSMFYSDSCGGMCVLVNLRNDHICHGYLGVIPVVSEEDYAVDSSRPLQVFHGGNGYEGTATITSTGSEDGRAITSPDGAQAYFVFNFLKAARSRVIGVMDYNNAPNHTVMLNIKGHNLRGIEKNWTPFFVASALHFLYTIAPTTILRCPTVAMDAAARAKSTTCAFVGDERMAGPSNFGDVIVRGSSPLLEHRWPFYVGLVHSRRNTLVGRRRGYFWKPCYRSEVIVVDVTSWRVVHMTEALRFGPKAVEGLGRSDSLDTYNQYATGIWRAANGVFYIGVGFDDQHPVIARVDGLGDYVKDLMKSNRLDAGLDRLHKLALEMRSTATCSRSRMSTAPQWVRLQRACPKERYKRKSKRE